MKQKDLLLVGGGFIAGYVICKMMNRNSSTESFSADGQRAQGAETTYKWNTSGKPLWKRGLYQEQIVPTNSVFRLTGVTKILTPKINPNGGVIPYTWQVSQTGKGTKYVESTLTHTKTFGNGSHTSRIWFPADSVTQI